MRGIFFFVSVWVLVTDRRLPFSSVGVGVGVVGLAELVGVAAGECVGIDGEAADVL